MGKERLYNVYLVIVHLKLENCPEENVDVVWVGVDNDAVNLLLFYFFQHRSIVFGAGLTNVNLEVFRGRRSHQVLEPGKLVDYQNALTRLLFFDNTETS